MGNAAIYVLALIGLFAVFLVLVTFLHKALDEARQSRKTIEFGGLLIGLISTLIAIGGLVYTVNTVDALSAHVEALERAVQSRAGVSP